MVECIMAQKGLKYFSAEREQPRAVHYFESYKLFKYDRAREDFEIIKTLILV